MKLTIEVNGKKMTGYLNERSRFNRFKVLNTPKIKNQVYDIMVDCTLDNISSVLTDIISMNEGTRILDVTFVRGINQIQIISNKKLNLPSDEKQLCKSR